MPGFNQQQLNYRARSANRVTVLIGDQPVAFAQTLSHTFDFGTQGLYGIGSSMPQEIQQLRVAPSITVDTFSLTQNGQDVLGYPASIMSVLANNEFAFTLIDGTTGLALLTYVGGVCSNFNEHVPANQIITDAITFLCADVLDENGQSIMQMGDAYKFPALYSNTDGVVNVV